MDENGNVAVPQPLGLRMRLRRLPPLRVGQEELHHLRAALKQALRFAMTEKEIPETVDAAAQANLMLAFVIGRWHQFAKSGFKRDPVEHWPAQWPRLI